MTGDSRPILCLWEKDLHTDPNPHDALLALARSLGASAAVVLPTDALVVKERFAALCEAPHRCPSYGLAPGCPPHAPSSAAFRALLTTYRSMLVFKIDAPVADLMGPARLAIARTIHGIAAGVERAAQSHGLNQAKGMAAGSCKELFCIDEADCPVVTSNLPCRFPDLARPSISAVGIDFTALAAQAGWPFGRIELESSGEENPATGLMAGLVLLA